MTLEDLRKRKKELRLTNKELADLSGIPVSTVAKILGGTTAKPRRDTLRAIEQVLFGDSEAGLLDSVKLEGVLRECKQQMLDKLSRIIAHVNENAINRTSRVGTL